MIYEARPNVTVDAAGLALKSGNAAVLRGGSAAAKSNEAIVAVLQDALESVGLPRDAVQSIDAYGREGARVLMNARGLVDVLVPRGGRELIQQVVRDSTVPAIETGEGNCHVYLDATAPRAALHRHRRQLQDPPRWRVQRRGDVARPPGCRARQCYLRSSRHWPTPGSPFTLTPRTAQVAPEGVATVDATDEDYATEYLSMDIAVKVVDDLDEALAHIRRFSTGHTEAIVTDDIGAADRFVAGLDSAAIMVNASTRFTDGAEFGLGAEIGISTQKLHARGPMGLAELTTTTWIAYGDGHVRG